MKEEQRTVVNLVSESDEKNNIIISPIGNKDMYLPYFKEEKHFVVHTEYVKFVKSVEALIRRSKEYKAYISYLKGTVGLKKCMIFGNVDDDMAPVEMHHGPIFTLYDYVEIELISVFKKNKEPVSSFRIADHVLQNHFDNIIQVVMLSEAAHLAVHPTKKEVKPEFVDIDSAWGNIVEYINRYGSYFSYNHVMRLKRYMEEWQKFKKEPNSKFSVFSKVINKWGKEAEDI